ncbi:MAG: hypothetical protein ACK5Q5_20860 [Planctomycetaceae bacterium]
MSRILVIVAALCALPSTVLAHPGHGETAPDSLTHYAFEPVHLLPVVTLLAVAMVAWAVRHWKRNR